MCGAGWQGRGVFIGNECVALCDTILQSVAGVRPQIPAWQDSTDEQILEQVPRIATARNDTAG